MQAKPRKRRLIQPPSEYKGSKFNRASEIVQSCTLSSDQRDQCPSINVEDLLKTIIYPEKPGGFMDSIWNKRAYAVLNAPVSRFEDLVKTHFFDLDIRQLLESTISPQVFAWMKDQNNKISSIELSEEAAMRCYNCGASLYFRAPQEISEALVKGIAEGTKMNFAGRYPNGELRGEVEIFVSRKGHITDWHFDYMHNFTLQLKGIKRWRLSTKNAVPNPIRGCTPHYSGIDTLEQQLKIHRLSSSQFNVRSMKTHDVVTLTPGSFMYFPPGMWHRVECTEDSISINISMMPSSWSDLVCDGIRHMMWKDKNWREGIANMSRSKARTELHNLLYDLKRVVSKLTVDDLLPPCMLKAERETVSIRGSDGKTESKNTSKRECKPDEMRTKLYQISVNPETRFRLNHLSVLMKESDVRKQVYYSDNLTSAGSLCSEDSGDETDDTKASVCAVANGSHVLKKEEIESSSSRRRSKHADVTYLLNINFGNEQLESAAEFKFVVSKKFEAAMDFLVFRREPFTLRDLMSRLNENLSRSKHAHLPKSMAAQPLPVGEIIHLLRNMVYYGHLVIEKSIQDGK